MHHVFPDARASDAELRVAFEKRIVRRIKSATSMVLNPGA